MKRYWKLISLACFIVLIIGTFYIQESMASSKNPDFLIKNVSGNEEEVKGLSIFGEFTIGNHFRDTFSIDDTGTTYTSERSFIETFNGTYQVPEIKQLQHDYRSFMRGKAESSPLFYEDEAHLAYVNIDWDYEIDHNRPSNFSFEVEVLDKDSKDVTVINESIPKQNQYDHAYVVDVQKIDGELKAVVRIIPTTNDNGQSIDELHVYTFDLASQRLIGDEILATADSGQRQHLTIINDAESMEPQKNLLIKKVTATDIPYKDGFTTEESDPHYTIYQYDTGEQKELAKEGQELNFERASIYDSTIYFMNMTTKDLEIHPYQIESGKFSAIETLPVKMPTERVEEFGSPVIKLKNNKIYVVSPYSDSKTEASVLIADLKTWKTLYEGTIERTNLSEDQKEYSLRIYSLHVE